MQFESHDLKSRLGIVLALALPFVTCLVQWLLWPFFDPFVWFLFFPAVFISAWIGRMREGIAAAIISSLLVWYFFIPPQMSFSMNDTSNSYSIAVFMLMGFLFSLTHDRLRKANTRAAEALASARAMNEQLQDANGKVNTLYNKTLELDRLKTRFFSNVSHELRTPLALILGPLKKTISEPGLSESVRCSLELMQRNAQLLHHHVSDLLDISKIEAGRMSVRYSQLDLAHLLRVMASHFEGVAADRAIRYSISAPEVLATQTDGEKIQRILLNLLSNAFKFVPDGGSIDLMLENQDDQAIIRVMDNGLGIPAEMRGSVFERFYQVDGYAARPQGGTGLGLSIVKEFAELLGGTIVCGEAPEKGALFILTIPLFAPDGAAIESEFSHLDNEADIGALYQSPQAKAACSLPSPATQPWRSDLPLVLVVEDNPDMNGYIANTLQPHCRVASAFDGRQGLEMATKMQPDIIISDVMMPNLSGDQMVAELRKHPELTDVPIVMLTARADDELRVNMLRLGVQEYLNKPFSDEELLARIGRLLADRKRSIEQLRASEAKILRLNAELEQRVEERTTELLAANRELDAFAYAVSHDLRAPLRAMSGFSQALIEDYGDRLEGEARVFLDQIIIGSRRMGELIDGLLTLSRTTRGELRRDRVQLSAMAERLLNELSSEEPGRKVQWTVMPALSVTGDEAMLEVVMRNLLSNAWKYTSNRDQADISFYARQEGSQQLFFVADNGAGFETAHAAKLFQPFQRLHRQEEFPGIGIGLATAQRIIHRHGGMIRAEGQQDRGATFSFSIPNEH